MKFHRIETENLNSLYDEQSIDLDGDLNGAPLYLIMGPTGSGKTTILDAICLALFGTTPRLKEIGSRKKRGARILSHGRGEARAKVVFSVVRDGERVVYEATWDFRRAYGNPDGTPQTPNRQLRRRDGSGEWEVLANSDKKKNYEDEFEEALGGLELEDFLRSVLLPQGQFANFLKADEDEKADILERLTDTDKYQAYGRLAFEKWQEVHTELESAEDRLEDREEVSDERLQELSDEIDELSEAIDEIREAIDEEETRRDWLKKRGELRENLEEAREEAKEAKQRRAKHREKFESLERAERVEPLRQISNKRDSAKQDCEELADKIEELDDKVEARQEKLEEAEEQKDEAETRREAKKEKLEEMRGPIKETRKVKNDLENAEKQLDEAEEELEERGEVCEKQVEAVEEAEQALEAAREQTSEAEETYEEVAIFEPLVEGFGRLETRHEALAGRIDKRDEDRESLEKLDAKLQEKREAAEKSDERLEKLRDEIAPLEQTLEEAREAFDEKLDGADSYRERRDELTDRKDGLQETRDRIEDLVTLVGNWADEREELEALHDQRERVDRESEEVASWGEAFEHRRKEIGEKLGDIEQRVERLEEAEQFVEARRALADGEECPVCGSTEHPYRGGEGEDAANEELEKARERRDVLADEVDALEEARRQADTRGEVLANARQRIADDIDSAESELDDIAAEIDETVGKVDGLEGKQLRDEGGEAVERLGGQIDELDEQIEEVDEQVDGLDDAREAREEAGDELEAEREKLDDLEDDRKDRTREIESLEERREEAAAELEELDEQIAEEKADLREELLGYFPGEGADLEPLADGGIGEATLEELLEAARQGRNAFKQAEQTLEEARDEADQVENDLEQACQQLENAEGHLEEAKSKVESREETVEGLEEAMDEKLDGRDPDELEEKLEEARDAAQEAFQEARDEWQKLRDRLKDVENTLGARREDRAEAVEEFEAADETFWSGLADIEGIADLEDVEEAMLEPERLQQLREMRQEIKQEVNAAENAVEQAEERLEAHREKLPDNFDPEEADLDELEARLESRDERRQTLTDERGGLKARREELEKKREQNRELRKELDELREREQVWDEMRKLIGVKKGHRFKKFAQALNLENIVQRANHHLVDLSDRYELDVKRDEHGFPQLDFVIKDGYQANRRRELSTLSGGETFLVSLALALALADNDRIDMPIETLFLDEGFGTLDRDSLQTAVQTLNSLHSTEGRSVGVISHVEALQEQIAHRVVVEPVDDGRSKLRVERG